MDLIIILNTILIALLCLLGFLIWIAWTGIKGAPWIPTPKKNVRSMLKLAGVSSRDVLYDLGSGDGRIIIMAAKEFGAKSIGIELDPIRVLWSKLKIRRAKLTNEVKVIKANFFDAADAYVGTFEIFQVPHDFPSRYIFHDVRRCL